MNEKLKDWENVMKKLKCMCMYTHTHTHTHTHKFEVPKEEIEKIKERSYTKRY